MAKLEEEIGTTEEVVSELDIDVEAPDIEEPPDEEATELELDSEI